MTMPTGITIRSMGDAALLIELPDVDTALALALVLADNPARGQLDVVPGARTVLVRCEPGFDAPAVAAHIRAVEPRGPRPSAAEVVIDTLYGGADLDEVGRLTGLGAAGVVAAHTGCTWTVTFAGFTPGFAYLSGGDHRLQVPRRDHPRQQVPSGAVGLADDFCGIYPRASPGGWQLIGSTGARLWELDRDPPALLLPGTRVRFREVR